MAKVMTAHEPVTAPADGGPNCRCRSRPWRCDKCQIAKVEDDSDEETVDDLLREYETLRAKLEEGGEDEEEEEDEDEESWDDNVHRVWGAAGRDGAALFIGSQDAQANATALTAANITHILSVGTGLEPAFPERYTYRQVAVEDAPTEDLVAHLAGMLAFVDGALAQRGRVLVHCLAGVSRSAAVCLGFLMCRQGRTLDQAWKELHAARPWVAPNKGFMAQLRHLESLQCDLSKWTPAAATDAWLSVVDKENKDKR